MVETTKLDDAALLRAVLDCDDCAWRELVRRYSGPLRDAARQATESVQAIDDDELDDVLGDLWLYLLEDHLRRLRSFDANGATRLLGWLKMLVVEIALKRVRATRRRRTEPLSEKMQIAALPPREEPVERERLLTPQEVADRLKVSRKQAYRLIRAHMVPCSLGARTLRVPVAQLDAFLRRRAHGVTDARVSSRPRVTARLIPTRSITSAIDSVKRTVQPKAPRTRPRNSSATGKR
jgi:excisionase family DNA binding protein